MRPLPQEPPASEITPLDAYLRRREFMKNVALYAATTAAVGAGLVAGTGSRGGKRRPQAADGAAVSAPTPSSSEQPALDLERDPLTPYDAVTTYNNYYELGLSKTAPAELASSLKSRPWTITVEGEIKREQRLDIDTLRSWFPVESRVYRMRCVEAWSMVIPWLGIPLGALIKRLEPTSRAKYVAFTTLLDPEQLPGQRSGVLDWPYVEGLRIDEATHPLALLATGLYGKDLPGQNGAPLRLVVPWKYGFKGIKSIVRMRFTETKPPTTWNIAGPREYGFFANVNPAVDHPRWSQATERRIGEIGRRPTLPFNGYADAVASLYDGMDLRVDY